MKIGVWLGSTPKATKGGAYSYTDRLIKLIDEYQFDKGIEICFLGLHGGDGSLRKRVIGISQMPLWVYRIVSGSKKLYKLLERFDVRIIKRRGLMKILPKHHVKLVYYLTQGYCLDSNFPFVATNWDIGHCSTYSFPELMWDGNSFESRESYYREVLPKALMVLCDSETGKEELLKYTLIGEHKIRILPIFAGEVSTLNVPSDKTEKVLSEYGLEKNRYFFYPAQFWAHKNHYNLVRAFAAFLSNHQDYKLVLSGSDKGNKDYIKELISNIGIQKKVIFLGFVPIETLFCMYKNATALVMASHFGPTNMPPIEAMEIGCPVLCSDLGGHREILGDSAVYFNSMSIESIEEGMKEIVKNHNQYVEKILKQKSVSLYNAEKSMDRLNSLLVEVAEVRNNWGV